MDFFEFQQRAESTAIYKGSDPAAFYMLGLAGEVGTLLAAWKKLLRDGGTEDTFRPLANKELGDILWYSAQIANELGVALGDVAEAVLVDATQRWLPSTGGKQYLDEDAPPEQQLPREFEVKFTVEGGRTVMSMDGQEIGDPLTDNSHEPDEYRFHDIFHLAHAAVLGWSPVFRSLLGRKRKYDAALDEVEDGARAIFIEEGLTVLVFGLAAGNQYFEDAAHVDTWLLETVRRSVVGLEVSQRSAYEWEVAILEGYRVWRAISKRGHGTVRGDLAAGTIEVVA